ncbi:hypothetical protein WB401_34020 [Streptomyces brasiliscabiei]|uniref:DNA-binding protein n=1 Tax=Streptomyces brasiliscabiei TaxID=2736302 RepID=A0ABU8GQ05_9ACTN
MADANLSGAPLPAHADPHPPHPHPLAAPGYGKRTAPGQLPRAAHDFADLPPREAAIAAYLDRLPDGADISVKTLAKELPYGQCALRTALNKLQDAGHLRRGREHLTAKSGTSHWITRTWFTRTARDDTWWASFTRGDVPEESYKPPPTRSRAVILLAALGRTTPALSLSQADCVTLAPLLTPWFERGATEEHIRRALTAGLPTPVHSPAALIRTRLRDKLPPEPEPVQVRNPEPEPTPPPPLRMLECAHCRAPGRPEALPGGVCGACRGERAPTRPHTPLSATAVHTHAAQIRAAMSQQPREGTPV